MGEKKVKQGRAVGPKLRLVLHLLLGGFVLLSLNALYLVGVRLLEYQTGELYQDHIYQFMFLGHLVLGLLVVFPFVAFGLQHWKNTRHRKPSATKRLGSVLLLVSVLILVSGLLLVRLDGLEFLEIRAPGRRALVWWIHVVTPLLAVWVFVLHRLTGPRLRWKLGLRVMGVSTAISGLLFLMWLPDPRGAAVKPDSGDAYFDPSLARTASGGFIPARELMNDVYCQECHPDTHTRWKESAHKFSSFNNDFYRFSVRETRRKAFEREGTVQDARFCAGCHDPVPFFSGAFDDPNYDDVNHPTAHAGITCTVCHAITEVRSPRGNSDYVIDEPIHYPFAKSDSGALRWLSNQLIKSKPGMHKKTFLKPFHKEAEFCGTCHKVHLPESVNDYRWLRGQNHYDSYHLSGVSGHGVQSFYYPPKAQETCNGCHMAGIPSQDFGAKVIEGHSELHIKDHLFPAANTALPAVRDAPKWVNQAHREMLEGSVRVDIFGVREGDDLRGPLVAPLDVHAYQFEAGKSYVVDVVVRTLTLGHHLTQGTADSNQLWVEVVAGDERGPFGHSGGISKQGRVDPYSHFVNSYVLDRHGGRIDRRNAEDIYVALYNHQIPPGAADVLHYNLRVPSDAQGEVWIEARLRYRKFDQTYVEYVYPSGAPAELPITDLGRGRYPADKETVAKPVPGWIRWNDFGIGNLRKPRLKNAEYELMAARAAFEKVVELGEPSGWLNVARTYIADRRYDKAAEALERARPHRAQLAHWTFDWLAGVINLENGYLDEAIENFEAAMKPTAATAERGFDFTADYRLLNELATAYFERSKQARGDKEADLRAALIDEAARLLHAVLQLDPENQRAHYSLSLLEARRGRDAEAEYHRNLHQKYKTDEQAREGIVSEHRSGNAAVRAATEGIVIYDLHREGAPGL